MEPHGVIQARGTQTRVRPSDSVPSINAFQNRVITRVGKSGGVQDRVIRKLIQQSNPDGLMSDMFAFDPKINRTADMSDIKWTRLGPKLRHWMIYCSDQLCCTWK